MNENNDYAFVVRYTMLHLSFIITDMLCFVLSHCIEVSG